MRSGPFSRLESPSRAHGIIIWNMALLAPPEETTSWTLLRSSPSFEAVAIASAITALVPIEMKLLMSFIVWPLPSGPASMIVSA